MANSNMALSKLAACRDFNVEEMEIEEIQTV